MAEEAYMSLPQRAGGRGKRSATSQGQGFPQAQDIVSSSDQQDIEQNEREGIRQKMAMSSQAASVGRYRTEAEGDACYECELRYCGPAADVSSRLEQT